MVTMRPDIMTHIRKYRLFLPKEISKLFLCLSHSCQIVI